MSLMVMLCNMAELKYFSENDLLSPVTPNNPRLTFDPINTQEGLKLINLCKSYGHAMVHEQVIAFLVKMTFWP